MSPLRHLDVLYTAGRGEPVRHHSGASPGEFKVLAPTPQVVVKAPCQGLVARVVLFLLPC